MVDKETPDSSLP